MHVTIRVNRPARRRRSDTHPSGGTIRPRLLAVLVFLLGMVFTTHLQHARGPVRPLLLPLP